MAVLLPSGVGKSTEDNQFNVTYDGLAIELTFVWPELMTSPETLHRIWKSSSNPETQAEGTLRANGFRPALRGLRYNTAQEITAKCKIYLPMFVRPEQ